MARVITGTKQHKARQAARVLKATHGTNKIRCPNCKELAIQVPDGMGGLKHKCKGCGREFGFNHLG